MVQTYKDLKNKQLRFKKTDPKRRFGFDGDFCQIILENYNKATDFAYKNGITTYKMKFIFKLQIFLKRLLHVFIVFLTVLEIAVMSLKDTPALIKGILLCFWDGNLILTFFESKS